MKALSLVSIMPRYGLVMAGIHASSGKRLGCPAPKSTTVQEVGSEILPRPVEPSSGGCHEIELRKKNSILAFSLISARGSYIVASPKDHDTTVSSRFIFEMTF